MAAIAQDDDSAALLAELRCPVRRCGEPLPLVAGGARCARGHAFDRAHSGYLNLLQPQDRRSLAAGDTREATLARRRIADAGALDWLVDAVAALLADAGLPPRPRLLDVGCGEGSMLLRLAGRRSLIGHGLDLSAAAIELAARRSPGSQWVVANADRGLPWRDGSFDAVLSLTARLHPVEMARVLAPRGVVVVAVPGADDLVELRAAVLGQGESRDDRLARVVERCAGALVPVREERVGVALELTAAQRRDLLASSYRGARRSQTARLAELGGGTVTMSRDIVVLRAP